MFLSRSLMSRFLVTNLIFVNRSVFMLFFNFNASPLNGRNQQILTFEFS